MRYRRYLIPDAHVRSVVIVEVYVTSYHIFGMSDIIELPFPVDTLYLYNPIYTFRYGIVGRLVVFCHANRDVVLLKKFHVRIAAILYAAVRVMYQSGELFVAGHLDCLFYRLPQCGHGGGSTQGISQFPTYDFVGIGIGYQM